MNKNPNKKTVDTLKAKGKLNNLINNQDISFLQKLLNRKYRFVLLAIAITAISLMIANFKEIKWKVVCAFVGICSVFGYAWGFWVLSYDPEIPCWYFLPLTIMGEFFFAYEDWLFYPLCSFLFAMLMVAFPPKKRDDRKSFWFVFFIYLGILIPSLFLDFCSMSIGLMFGTSSLGLMLLLKKSWDMRNFMIIFSIMFLMASIWDVGSSTVKPMLFDVFPQWVYISFDEAGNHYHSKALADYGKYKWAWIGHSPIAITPFFGITGGLANYVYYHTIKKWIG